VFLQQDKTELWQVHSSVQENNVDVVIQTDDENLVINNSVCDDMKIEIYLHTVSK